MAPCVARDRWHRAWPAIDGTVRGPREIPRSFLMIYLDKIYINGAGGRVTVVGCPRFGGFRCPCVCPSVVRGPRSMAPCVARRSNVAVRGLCGAIDRSVRGAIAVSDRSNVALRGLCSDFCQNSSEPRCGRSLRPIVFSTLVSYRAGRCLRTWVSSNVAVRRVC